MKTQLIKTHNSLILVSDETLDKFYEGFYLLDSNIFHTNKTILQTGCKKVLSQSPKLNKKIADEIGWINVEELGYEYRLKQGKAIQVSREAGFIAGFKKAQELNQKKYSEKDLIDAVMLGLSLSTMTQEPFSSEKFTALKDITIKSFIQSLSQPQQWQVGATEIDGVWTVNKII